MYYVYYNDGFTADDWKLFDKTVDESEALQISARIAGGSRGEYNTYTHKGPIFGGSPAIHAAYRAAGEERRAEVRAAGGWAP